MKLTQNINLAGLIFTIDQDALVCLESYLDSVEKNCGTKEECKEIIEDIEARMSELFRQRLSRQKEVLSLEDIDFVIETIGRPEQISGSNETGERPGYFDRPTRMFRDTENSIIAGVCSGMGIHFNVDPVILRIIFVLTLGFGSLLAYIIFWIVLPARFNLYNEPSKYFRRKKYSENYYTY